MRISIVAAVAIGSVLSCACSGGSPNVTAAGASPTKTPSSSSSRNVGVTSANANSQPSPEPSSNNVSAPAGGRRVPPPRTVPLGTPPPVEYRKGSENSLIATTMNSEGQAVEVRIFKAHPQLARVEATWLGPKEKLVRITLRNGSVIEVHTDQLASLATATTQQLVQLAGAAK